MGLTAMTSEAAEIATVVDSFPLQTRQRLRQAILRLIVVYGGTPHGPDPRQQRLALFTREGNVLRPSCWAPTAERPRRRRRAP